jgi:dihydroorotate dehydrogenase electron transfer subunit
LYKVVGEGTTLLSKMKASEALDILGPLGNEFDVDEKLKLAILVAGGYGVAPMVSLCEAIVNKNLGNAKNIYVLLGARSKDFVLCEDSFKELGVEVRIATDDGSYGTHGLVTDLLTNLLKDAKIRPILKETRAYSCGPTPMLKAVAGIAHKYGISSQASLESHMGCGVGACLCCVTKVKTKAGCTYKRVCKDGPIFDTEEIIWE